MDASGLGRGRGRGARGGGRGGGWGFTKAGASGRGRGSNWQPRDENSDSGNQQRTGGGGRGAARASRFDASASASGRTNQFERFVFAGLQKCPPHNLQKLIQDSETLWNGCWRKVAELPTLQLQIVLAALARLPFSSRIDPPNIRDVGRGVSSLLDELKSDGRAESDDKLAAVELVETLFERLIKFTWTLPVADVKDVLADMLSEAQGLMEGRHKEQRAARSRIDLLFERLDIEWTIKSIAAPEADASTGSTALAPLDWKTPTVGWLADWKHFQALQLPKLKVPGKAGDGVYDSPEEYFESVIKLWIGMTFVDGNNALLPHCSVRGANDKVCDQPLWPIRTSGKVGVSCKSHNCGRHVEFVCANRFHDRGYCGRCAGVRQEQLRGPPSSNASTHIYDCAVTSVRFDGSIYVEQVASRKPPLGTIHWKTTKRLASPNLVGIVVLESRGSSLRQTDPIYWAKVALHGNSRDEFHEREAGKVALSLLNYSHDDSPNPLLDRNVPKGTAIAIIDCLTFVPEFVPVLTALEHQRAEPMAFQGGALLNLRRRAERRLVELVTAATLDAGQLKSFMEALRFPVHCTQGPPGTGKSYLGVVVVRALLIVRDLWMKVSESVGAPPILVLSYKNHAIDEFLVDLMRKEPYMHHEANKSRFGGYRPLVRIGGGCNEPELLPYLEFNASRKSVELKRLADDIGRLHTLQDHVHRFRDRFSVIKESQFVLLDSGSASHDDSRKKRDRKVCQDAAAELKQVSAAVVACVSALHKVKEAGESSEDEDERRKEALDVVENAVVRGVPLLRRDDIALLFSGIRHYDPVMDPAEILHRWMTGFVPLPACAVEHCEGISDGTSALCSSHRCAYTADERVQIAQAAVDEPPRNVCEAHPLCWAVAGDDYCVTLARPGESYCEAHASMLCEGADKNGKPCQAQALSRSDRLCFEHKAEQKAQAVAIDDSKCRALNAKGKPCKSPPLAGAKYCAAHRSKAAVEDEEKAAAVNPPVAGVDGVIEVVDTASEDREAESTQAEVAVASASDEATSDSAAQTEAATGDNDDVDSEKSFFDVRSCSSDGEVDFDADKFDFDNYDEVEESEHLQHLREVDEVAEAANRESDDDDYDDEKDSEHEADDVGCVAFDLLTSADNGNASTAEWSWEMPLPVRWASIAALLNQWSPVAQQLSALLKQAIGSSKRALYFEELKLKARAFEGKAVIGGTITGCVARLEAIRATNPFAILVEEASEVLEPLLFSCLCSSTCKLEMIGDHLQLQPSVMSKFDFERVNRINVSMFERLIRSPPTNPVPSSVLSIQRRMRKDIADFTRAFYVDITDIEDHEVCLTKTIQPPTPTPTPTPTPGRRASASPVLDLLQHCEGRGREVPGVLPHVFFWEHFGAESRAKVGLSRVNANEAEMACALAKYLETCGVPPRSIAILTPYKGQLMLMRDLLMRKYKMVKSVKHSPSDPPRPVPSCTLSTVDRFQGDEADVVIISLVIDGKSTTPFVRLQNRMIVLLSRARIGMFVLGNTKYFDETPHWKAAFDLLRQSVPSDNAQRVDRTCRVYSEPRIGLKLPLCCPQHRQSTAMASHASDLRLSFCTVVCSEALPCSHACGLPCHYPKVATHNATCKVATESPCTRHPRTLACSYFTTATQTHPIADALKRYRCDVLVDAHLPCTHEQSLKCADTVDIAKGLLRWPQCKEKAIAPYMYPKCKHLKSCSCVDYHRFMAGGAPPCEKSEEYHALCGHRVAMPCHRRTEVVADPSKFVCKQSVVTQLPRCGHRVSVACPIAQSFELWTGATLATFGVVSEGSHYGPKDYSCTEIVTFRRRCGHEDKVKCEQAFDIVVRPPPCTKRVMFKNPECGHTHQTTCSDAKRFDAIVERALEDDYDDDAVVGAPVERVEETNRSAVFRDLGLGIRCSELVTFVRKCGHSEQVTCNAARHSVTACEEQVQVTNPCCGHQVRIPCESVSALQQWNPWSLTPHSTQTLVDAVKVLHANGVLEDAMAPPLPLPPSLASLAKDCEHSLLFRRVKSCGHDVRVKCGLAMKALNPATGGARVPACTEAVTKRHRTCDHELKTVCSRDIANVRCREPVQRACWNFGQCQSTVRGICSTPTPIVQCSGKATWTCARGHSAQLELCSRGIPQQCPMCAFAALEAEIREVSALMASSDAVAWPPREAASAVRQLDGAGCVPLRANKIEFLKRKLAVLERFKRSIEKVADVWSRPVFQPMLIPVVAMYPNRLGAKAPSPDFSSFEMRDFGDASSQGIQVREATRQAVEALVAQRKGSERVLVFGVAYSLGVCLDTKGYPRSGRGLAGLQANWINQQRERYGFDALGSQQKSEPLTLWEPYAAFPTHKLVLAAGDPPRALFVDRLPTETTWRTQSRLVAFTQPQTLAAQAGDTGSAQPAGDAGAAASEYLDKLHPLLVAAFPWANGLTLFQFWDGRAFSISGETTLPTAVELELRAKLSFVAAAGATPSGARPNPRARPFAGLSMLRNFTKQQSFVESDLLRALEYLALDKRSTTEATQSLKAYVSAVKTARGHCHPLVLLAFARFAGRDPGTRAQPLEFLKLLRDVCPHAVEHWLFADERTLLDPGVSDDAAGSKLKLPDDASVDERWCLLKQHEGCHSDAMEELLKLVGLRRVKDSALKLFKSALALQKMPAAKRKKNALALNYCFMGNPGTGKTTVARLFARILHDSGMRTSQKIQLCGAQELKDEGAVKFRDKIKQAMGGVIFIDEAYELDPMGDASGKPIVSELLIAAEDKRDELSIILAGYEEDIQQKLYKYNDGLKSRFEEIFFDDFDEADLRVVWNGLLADREWVADDTCGVIACRRLARGAGIKGFGNARAVRRLVEQATQAAMDRKDFNGIMEIRTVDVLGERPTKNPKLAAVLAELDDKIGWSRIKTKVHELVAICDKNYERELNGIDTIPVSLNRLFLGSPGTGKTTFAGIYGRVLKCLHFLSIGEVVVKTASDFVGQYVGQSQTKTSDILKLAKGKVLVVDEAYNLDGNLYGKQVLDVLVEKVQGTERDDIAVILIGYETPMLEMLRTQNQGLARRFPAQSAFYFDDYSEQELLDIFLAACAKKKVHCPFAVAELAIRQLALQKSQANFGNAGAVEQLLRSAIANASARPLDGDTITLVVDDVESEVMKRARLDADAQRSGTSSSTTPASDNPLALLDALYCMEGTKAMLEKIQTSIQVAQDEGSEIPKIGHFVFRGAPGTGKTTVARAIAKIFHRMGILATDKLEETSGLNLTGEYVGHTKKRVEEQLEKARGGVLFVDEAYELGKGHFGEEAMTSLVAAMTNPMYGGMVIIIAGYPRDLDAMLDRNAGLKSRFNRFVDFPDWKTDNCVAFTLATSKREGYELGVDALASVRRTFDALRQLPMFGNGRDVMQMWAEMLDCRAQRVKMWPELMKTISAEDADAAGRVVLAGRTPATGELMQQSSPSSGPVAVDDDARRSSSVATSNTEGEKQHESDSDSEKGDESAAVGKETAVKSWDHVQRDPGVAEATWAELERAKRENEEMMRELKNAADRAAQEAAKRKLDEFVTAQKKLQRIGKCPMGFAWLQVGGGWRCAGGSHFVSDAELQRNFTN
ncbi:hypothetical protein PybrP1_004317 [[Pythium] brassicae (nom. inval.)]|nr:hypothetical protein PybrP1_004317 [[Pythium] brassicae (nom. inval.)]